MDDSLALAQRFVELDDRKAIFEAELKTVIAEKTAIEARLMDVFIEAGVKNISIDGRTIYMHRQRWARIADGVQRADAIKAAEALGLADAITVSTQTLSAFMREYDKIEDIPEEVRRVFAVEDRHSLRSRRA